MPAALAAAAPAGGAEGELWTLQRIAVASEMGENATIVSERYDATGGAVEIRVAGEALDICRGGSETLRFAWQFVGGAEIVAEGTSPSALLTGELAGAVEPCTQYFAERSGITISGSGGITWALPPDEMEEVDTDRFHDAPSPLDLVFANAAGERTSTTRAVYMAPNDPVPGRPFGYFIVRVVVHGMPGELKYVYVFSRS
jgi:hypothetical protein